MDPKRYQYLQESRRKRFLGAVKFYGKAGFIAFISYIIAPLFVIAFFLFIMWWSSRA